MAFLLKSFFFFSFLSFFIVIPARLLFAWLKIEIKQDSLVRTGVYLGTGISLFILLVLILRILKISPFWLWALPLLSYIWVRKVFNKNQYFSFSRMKELRVIIRNNSPRLLIILSIIIFSVLIQNIVMYRGGWQAETGVLFPDIHDVMWNISLLTELYHHFPPQHPGMAGEMLRNNHYFYPLFLAEVHRITHLSVFDLYFRFGPLLVSTLYGLSIYAVSTLFTKKTFFRALSIFLGFFTGNFAYFIPLFLGRDFDWRGNTFFADQPFDQIINPYTVLGFSLFLLSLYIFAKFTTSQKKQGINLGLSLAFTIIVSVLYGVKSFGGVVVVLALGITTVYAFLLYRQRDIFYLSFITGLLFIPIFLFTTEPRNVGLAWVPGWLLSEMMTGADKLNLPQYAQIEHYYQQIGNYLGYMKIKLFEFAVYTIGNLGIRLLGLIYLLWMLISQRVSPHLNGSVKIFILVSFGVSFFLPILTNLKVVPHNIIQFTPYALVVTSILTASLIEKFHQRFPQKGRIAKTSAVVLVVIILALPVNLKNAVGKFGASQEKISHAEMKALRFLRDFSCSDEIVLIDPRKFVHYPIYVPALTERRVYLASSGYAIQTGRDPTQRMDRLISFFEGKIDGRDFLVSNNISYVYALKSTQSNKLKKFFSDYALLTFFENEEVLILKMIPRLTKLNSFNNKEKCPTTQ